MATDTQRARRFYDRGLHYYRGGRWVDAAVCLRDAVKLYPEHTNARLYLGASLARQRAYLDAVQVLEEGRHQPNINDAAMAKLLRLLSVVCLIRQDFPAATYYLERALEITPDEVELQHKLASVMCKSGQFEDGFDIYLRVAKRGADADADAADPDEEPREGDSS